MTSSVLSHASVSYCRLIVTTPIPGYPHPFIQYQGYMSPRLPKITPKPGIPSFTGPKPHSLLFCSSFNSLSHLISEMVDNMGRIILNTSSLYITSLASIDSYSMHPTEWYNLIDSLTKLKRGKSNKKVSMG